MSKGSSGGMTFRFRKKGTEVVEGLLSAISQNKSGRKLADYYGLDVETRRARPDPEKLV